MKLNTLPVYSQEEIKRFTILNNHINPTKLKETKRKADLSYERLHELIYYDPLTGHFFWTSSRKRKNKGSRAGSKSKNGYVSITIDGKSYSAQRLAWLYMEGYFPEHEIDHINRIKYDNRWDNLRHVTHTCNVRNIGITKSTTSRVVGVNYNGKKWYVNIGHLSCSIQLGAYEDFLTAVRVRWEAEKLLGYPDCNSTSTAFLYLKQVEETQIKVNELLKTFKD